MSDERHPRSSAALVARLLHDAELSELSHMEWSEQIKYFLTERSHLLHQVLRKKSKDLFSSLNDLFFSFSSSSFEHNSKNSTIPSNVAWMTPKRKTNGSPFNIVPNRKNYFYTKIFSKPPKPLIPPVKLKITNSSVRRSIRSSKKTNVYTLKFMILKPVILSMNKFNY